MFHTLASNVEPSELRPARGDRFIDRLYAEVAQTAGAYIELRRRIDATRRQMVSTGDALIAGLSHAQAEASCGLLPE